MQSETDKAYIAGLVDGEGHIAINLRSGQWSGHQVVVKITNTNAAVLERIAVDYGATVGKPIARNGWKPVVNIHWSANRAVEFLRAIRPYLRIKAEIADVALAFAETIRRPDAKARAITAEEWAYREQLRLQIRTLNLRSGSDLPEVAESPQILKGEQTCVRCGAKFTALRKRKYCTPKCLQEQSKAWRLERNERTCLHCGKTFNGQYHQKYCSHRCGSKALWARRAALQQPLMLDTEQRP